MLASLRLKAGERVHWQASKGNPLVFPAQAEISKVAKMRRFVLHCGLVLCGFVQGCGPSMPENQFEAIQERNRAGEERLRSIGKLDLKSYGPLGSGWIVKLDKATVDEQLIADLHVLDRITELHLPGATITDAQLEGLLSSKLGVFLNVVDFSGTNVTDAAVKPLVTLAYLQKVNIAGTKISDGFVNDMLAQRRSNPGIPSQCKKVAFTK